MKQKHLLLPILFILFFTTYSYAQQASGGVKGRVIDSRKRTALAGAVIAVRMERDSVFKVTDTKGGFLISGLARGNARIQISFVGYRTAEMPVSIEGQILDVGTITLTESDNAIDSVTVEYKVPLMTQTGDTIKYNPLAVKTEPYDYAIDLVEKLPGISVDDDGKVTALGKDVTWAFVDGKLLFGRNVMNALDNVKISDIKSINIYDVPNPEKPLPEGDLQDEDKQRVLDIKTKSRFRHAYNAEAYGGWGLDMNQSPGTPRQDRYLAGGNIRKFSEHLVMTADVQGNNMNRQRMGYRHIFLDQGGSSSGYYRNNRAEVSIDRNNPFIKRKGPGFKFNYSFSNSHSNSGSVTEKVYFEENADEASQDISRTRDTSFNRSDSYNHDFNLMLNKNFANRTFLGFSPSFTLTDNRSTGQQVSNVFSRENGALKTRTGSSNHSKETGFSSSGRINLFTALRKPKPTAADTLKNRSHKPDSKSPEDSSAPPRSKEVPSPQANAYRPNRLPGRRITPMHMRSRRAVQMLPLLMADLSWNYSDNKGSGWQMDTVSSANNTQKYLSTNSSGYTKDFGGNIRFANLKLGKQVSMGTNYSLSYDYSKKLRTAIDTLTMQIDTAQTYEYTRSYITQNIGVESEWYNPEASFQMRAGVSLKTSWSNRDEIIPEQFFDRRSFVSVLPTFSISSRYEESFPNKPNWNFSYSTSSSEPSLENMRNWLDISNPMSLTLGNPNLKQSYTHSLSFYFFKQKAETASETSLNLSASYTQNDMATKQILFGEETYLAEYDYTAAAGSTLTTYENINGAVSVNVSGRHERAAFREKFIFRSSLSYSFSRRPAYIRDVKNFTLSSSPSLNLSLQSNYSRKLEFRISSQTSYIGSANTVGGTDNTFSQRATANVTAQFLRHFTLYTSYQYYYYHSSKAADLNNNLLSAALSYRFLKNSGEARFTVYDILNRNSDFSSSVYSTYILNSWRQLMSRYFTLTLSYRFNKTGGGPGGPPRGPGGRHF